jgi:hypothetical protein
MREMRSSDPSHFATFDHPELETLPDRPPTLNVIRVNLDGVLYTLHAALAYFRRQEKDADGWRGKFVATGSNACVFSVSDLSTCSKTEPFIPSQLLLPLPQRPSLCRRQVRRSRYRPRCRSQGSRRGNHRQVRRLSSFAPFFLPSDEGLSCSCFGPSVVATGLAPPAFIEMLEREQRLTPMKTVTDGVDVFLNPKSRVTGAHLSSFPSRSSISSVEKEIA